MHIIVGPADEYHDEFIRTLLFAVNYGILKQVGYGYDDTWLIIIHLF